MSANRSICSLPHWTQLEPDDRLDRGEGIQRNHENQRKLHLLVLLMVLSGIAFAQYRPALAGQNTNTAKVISIWLAYAHFGLFR